MNKRFVMNGYLWRVVSVPPTSGLLVDSSGTSRLATTDPISYSVYISCSLHGDTLRRVLLHELGHCAIVSYNLLDDLYELIPPDALVDFEERLCNFIADSIDSIFSNAQVLLDGEGIFIVRRKPKNL